MSFSDEELHELYDRYAHVVYHRCLNILKNEEDAHDAVQETFAKVLRNAESFRNQSSPLTWMYRISTNHCFNLLRNRKGRRDKLHVHREEVVGDGTTRPPDDSLKDHELIHRLLEEADEQTRQVVIHTYFDDCTRKETAELVGISVPTVRKRLTTFLERARRTVGAATTTALLLLLPVLGASPPWSGS